ncbi:uncharacterized protein EV422DRAFT_575872 [Fimicolochytrium jonesii]|uniref:uncharacterized protein n=1 Tax=Fimicolochytrium jonesii TaxID=1396493 RepID=UPI0022FECF04|nr:uncharacterized protein EV422DRAFT_575872 [Fimicolochytrium jonesii]KAI8826029.1 hypothetical protein EV422DRAFT_575872 [Fimicolochytrium jonesii]
MATSAYLGLCDSHLATDYNDRNRNIVQSTLLPLSKGANNTFLNLLAPPPSIVHPLLGRMKRASLLHTFDNEIRACIRRIRAFAARNEVEPKEKQSVSRQRVSEKSKKPDPSTVPLHASSNMRRRLLATQLTKCWEMFTPHVDPQYVHTRMVEAGELIMEIEDFWQVANAACFDRFLESIKKPETPMSRSRPQSTKEQPLKSIPALFPVPLSSDADAKRGYAQPAPSSQAITPEALMFRAKYGQLVCELQRLKGIDTFLKNSHMVSSILRVLSDIMGVMRECVKSSSSKEVTSLLWKAGQIIKEMCDGLREADWLEEIADLLVESVTIIETSPELSEPRYLGWRVDQYTVIYNCLLRTDGYDQALDLIDGVMKDVEKMKEIHDLVANVKDIEGNENDPKTADWRDVITHSMFRLNVLMFGCEVRAMADGKGKEIATVEIIVKAPSAPGSAMGFRQRPSVTQDSAADDGPRTSVRTRTPLRKLFQDSPIRGAAIWKGQEDQEHLRGSSVLNLSQSQQSIAGLFMKGQGDAWDENSEDKGDSMVKLRGGGRKLARSLSTRAVGQLIKKQGYAPGRNMMRPGSLFDEGSALAEGTVSEGFNDLSRPKPRQQVAASARSTGKKGKPVAPKLDESEEGKARRQIMFDIMYMLASFHGDRDRFRAIVEGLHALSSSTVDMKAIERLSTDFDRRQQILLILLDVGFEIILLDSEEFLTPSRVMAAFTTELTLGKPPQAAELARIMVHHRWTGLNFEDLMSYCRKLYEMHQWQRFSVLGRLLDDSFQQDHFGNSCSDLDQMATSKELVLRLACINFHNVAHADRKVAFGADVPASSRSMMALNRSRFEISTELHTAAIAVLDALADCIESDSLVTWAPGLFVGTARLLWEYLEPMLRSINSVADAAQCENLNGDSLLIILLRFLHAVLTEMPFEDSLLLIDVAGKLALVLECTGDLEEAVQVLEDMEAVLNFARYRLGESAESVSAITCNLNFHPNTHLSDTAELIRVVNSSIDPTAPLTRSEKLQFSRRNLACAAVSVYRRLFRCRMKLSYHTREAEQRRKESQYALLTNKVLQVDPVLTTLKEEDIKKYCRENLALRALLCAAHASEGSNLSRSAKHDLLQEATSLLHRVHQDERRLLLDLNRKDVPPSTTALWRCPPPIFVRRSPTSITVRPVHMLDDNKQPVIPYTYQVFCRRVTSEVAIVSVADVAYLGTGSPLPTRGTTTNLEMIVSGLTPNERYVFAVGAYGEDGEMLGKGVGETSKPIVACLPLPLLLCWGQLSSIAQEVQWSTVADGAHKVLSKQYILWLAPDNRLRRPIEADPKTGIGFQEEEVFKLHETDLDATAPAIIRGYIESIYASIDRAFASTQAIVHSDMEGARDTLSAQMLRLRSCRELLVALKLADRIGDERLMLLSSFKCHELLVPLLQCDDVADPTKLQMRPKDPAPFPFVTQVLLACHRTFIRCSAILGNDRAQGVRDHYSFVAFHLTRRLLAGRRTSDIQKAVQVAEEALTLIRSIVGVDCEARIMSSNSLEEEWLGSSHKSVKRFISKKKGKGKALMTECLFHALLAASHNFKAGYDLSNSRRLESICEYFDMEIGKAHLATQASGPASQQAASARKAMDAASTTLREIHMLLTQSGPDVTMENLARYRKNPRFVELMAFAAAWCLAAGHFIDTAIRICSDAEDWTEKRNFCIVNFDQLMSSEEDEKQKDGWWSKKKKKGLFSDKTAGLSIAKVDDKKRGRKSQKETLKPPGPTKVQERASREPKGPVADARPPFDDEGEMPASKHAPPEIKEIPSTPGDDKAASSASGSRGSTASQREREQSQGKREQSPGRESRSRAGSAHSAKSRGAAPDGADDALARKRQRNAQRQAYLAGIPAADRDNVERAARILDKSLSAFWHYRRYTRRLRLIINYEAPARSRLALIHGLACLAHFSRDTVGKDFGPEAHVRDEPFELRKCGRILLTDLKIAHAKASKQAGTTDAASISNDNFRFIMDAYQGIVQSVVIGSRVGEWHQVLDSCKHLWNMQQRLLRRGVLTGADFRTNHMWRAWWIIGLCLLDFLQDVRIRNADDEPDVGEAVRMPSSRPSTGRSFMYPSRPVTATFRSGKNQRHTLPFQTYSELCSNQYVAGWSDQHGEVQTTLVDLQMIASINLFAIEAMHIASKYHRVMEFGLRFDQVFRGVYAPFLKPVLATAARSFEQLYGDAAFSGPVFDQLATWLASSQSHSSPSRLHWIARGLSAKLELTMAVTGATSDAYGDLYVAAAEAYEQTLKVSKKVHSRTMEAITSYEYAKLLHTRNDHESACLFWSKAIDAVFGSQRVVTHWVRLFAGTANDWDLKHAAHFATMVARAGGLKNIALAAMSATKMVQTSYLTVNLDKRLSLASFAARLFGVLLRGHASHPTDPLLLAHYSPPFVLPYLNLFSDPQRLDPREMATSLTFLAKELIRAERPWEALPLACLLDHLAQNILLSSPLTCASLLLKSEALIQMGAVSAGLDCILTIASGRALLSEDKMFYTAPVSGAGAALPAEIRFDETAHVLDWVVNLRVVRYIADHVIPDKLAFFMGQETLREYEMCRCRILIKLAHLAGLNDPTVNGSKLSMLLHQNLPPIGEIETLPTDGRRGSVVGGGTESSDSFTRSGSTINMHIPSGAAQTTTKRDAQALLNSVLFRVDAVLAKVMADLDPSEKLVHDWARFHLLVECASLAGQVHLLRWNLGMAMKCFSSIITTLEQASKFSPHRVDHWWQLHTTDQILTTSLMDGNFTTVILIGESAITSAKSLSSTPFKLEFANLVLSAERHSIVASGANAEDDAFAEKLTQFENDLTTAGSRYGCERILARGWEALGDSLDAIESNDLNRITKAYTKAEEHLKRIPAYTTTRPSGYSGSIPHLAVIQAKRALSILKLPGGDVTQAADLVDTACTSVQYLVNLPSTCTTFLALAKATVTAAARLQKPVPWETLVTNYTTLLKALTTEGEYRHQPLQETLLGLLRLYAERARGQINEDMRTTVAVLGSQAGRCGVIREGVERGSLVVEGGNVKVHEAAGLTVREYHHWAATQTGAQPDSLSNAVSLLSPTLPSEIIGAGLAASPPPTDTKLKTTDLITYITTLHRHAFLIRGTPDPYQFSIASRLHRAHALMAEQSHSNAYTAEMCVTDSNVSVIENVPTRVPQFTSEGVKSDALTFTWLPADTATREDGKTKDVKESDIVGVFTFMARRGGSAKGKKTSPGSKPSSSRSGTSGGLSASLIAHVMSVPGAKLQTVGGIMRKLEVLGDGDDGEEGFEVETGEIWANVLGTVRILFGVDEEVCIWNVSSDPRVHPRNTFNTPPNLWHSTPSPLPPDHLPLVPDDEATKSQTKQRKKRHPHTRVHRRAGAAGVA